MTRTPVWCILQAPRRRPQQGLQSLDVLKKHSGAFSIPKIHPGAFCKDQNVDFNKDCSRWTPRTAFWCTLNVQNTIMVHFPISKTPFWCILQGPKYRPQQGLQSSDAQNTTLVHFPFPKHQSGAFCIIENVDVNKDCNHWMRRTQFWCIFHIQNTILVHFPYTKHHSGAFCKHQNVDFNKDFIPWMR